MYREEEEELIARRNLFITLGTARRAEQAKSIKNYLRFLTEADNFKSQRTLSELLT